MTTSWPRPDLAAGPVCQQCRERDAGPAVFPAGAGSSIERAARRRTARRTVGAGILPQNRPGRQGEHRGGTEVGQLPKSVYSPAGYRGGGRNPRLPPSRGRRRRRTFRSVQAGIERSSSTSEACFTSSCQLPARARRTAVDGLGVRHLVEGGRQHLATTSNSCSGARGRLADERRQRARSGGRRPTAPACRWRDGAVRHVGESASSRPGSPSAAASA